MRPAWMLAFVAVLVGLALWWAGYIWLLARLGGCPWDRSLRRSRWLLVLLSTSLLPALAVFLSGKLPYTITYDQSAAVLYRCLTASMIGSAVVAQELILLQAARDEDFRSLMLAGWCRLAGLPARLARLPALAIRQARDHPIQLVLTLALLAEAVVQRWADINSAHPGDMDVMLSAVFATLQWPPFDYYHDYRPQIWVYNHLPLFPILVAPWYWLFENVLRLPTSWAAKMLIDLADLVIALLLYRQAVRAWRWGWVWGFVLAAAWLLAPWVIGGDDHPIAVAIAFALAAFAALERGWLSGLLLALGVATRSEIAFFVLPLALHYISRRGLGQTAAFLGVFGTTLFLVTAPFVLYDPEAMDYAIHRQIQRDAANQTSWLAAFLLPYLDRGVGAFLQQNSAVLAVGVNLLVATLALRDRRPLRVALLAALAYLLTLPLLQERYILFAYAVGLFYAARYLSPLVGAATLAAIWPQFTYGLHALLALAGGLIVVGLRTED